MSTALISVLVLDDIRVTAEEETVVLGCEWHQLHVFNAPHFSFAFAVIRHEADSATARFLQLVEDRWIDFSVIT